LAGNHWRVDAEALTRDRDQLLAEALYRHRAGAKWWPQGKMQWEALEAEQRARTVEDGWTPVVKDWLLTRVTDKPLTTTEILTAAIGLKPGEIDTRHTMRVGKIMKELGYERHQKRDEEGGRSWVYYRRGTTPHH
jgi:predicted P-loop ATPase